MLSLKCDHLFLCEFSSLFSTVKLNLGHNFSQFIHRFRIWYPVKRDGKLEFFEKPRLHFQIFPNSLKSLKIEIFVPLPSYFVKWWEWCNMWQQTERRSQLLMFKFSRKNVNIILQITILCQFKSWKYILFPNINEGIKCKIFLLWLCP